MYYRHLTWKCQSVIVVVIYSHLLLKVILLRILEPQNDEVACSNAFVFDVCHFDHFITIVYSIFRLSDNPSH